MQYCGDEDSRETQRGDHYRGSEGPEPALLKMEVAACPY